MILVGKTSKPLIGLSRIVLYLVVLWFSCGCSQSNQQTLSFTGATMGTRYNILVVVGIQDTFPDGLAAKIESTLVDFNQIMSTYIADSELSKINQAPENAWLSVSPSLFHVLEISSQMSTVSGGAFDVTVGPLVNLWGFGPEEQSGVPDASSLEAAVERVGYQLLQLDEKRRAVNKLADIYVDLSAIAKGYATDVIAGMLNRDGLKNFMIEIGGDLYLQGVNAEGKPWRIGVEKPGLAHDGAVLALALSNVGVATSGDYRNYREVNGKRISHTIDPATAKPVTHNMASVTVIAPTGAEADALATAISVMGPTKGMSFAEKHHLAIYMLVRENGAFIAKSSSSFAPWMNTE